MFCKENFLVYFNSQPSEAQAGDKEVTPQEIRGAEQKICEREFSALMNDKKHEEAIVFARRHLKEFPESATFLFAIGTNDFENGRYEEAEEHFLALLNLDADNSAAASFTYITTISLAKLYLETFQCDKVDALLNPLLAKEPDNWSVWELKGKKELIMGDIPAARHNIEQARQYAPDITKILLPMAQLELAELNFSMAKSRAESYLEDHPESIEAQLMIAQVHLADANYSLAKPVCTRILAKYPRYTGAMLMLGQIALANECFAEANQYAEQVLTLHSRCPGAHLLVKQVNILKNIDDKKHIVAASDLLRLSRDYPKNTAILGTLGYLHYVNNDFTQAEEYFRAVLALNKRDTSALSALAEILFQKGNLSKSKELADGSCLIDWKNMQGLCVLGKIALHQTPPDYHAAAVYFGIASSYYPDNEVLAEVASQAKVLANLSKKTSQVDSFPEFTILSTKLFAALNRIHPFRAPLHLEVVAF